MILTKGLQVFENQTDGYTAEQYQELQATASRLQWKVDSLPTTHTENNRITDTVTKVLSEAVEADTITNEVASELFDSFMNEFVFGVANPFNTWTVTIEFDGNTIELTDIEGDDEYAAIDEAKALVSINIDQVRYTVDIEGEGSYEVREDGYSFDIDTDPIMDGIEFSASRKFE